MCYDLESIVFVLPHNLDGALNQREYGASCWQD